MKSFEFKLYGGITITFEKEHMEIDVKGVKGLFFQRVKPRHKAIRYDEIVKVDYKEAGYTIGYIRFVTPEIENYPSSQYVAEVDENSIIFEKDEKEKYESWKNWLDVNYRKLHREIVSDESEIFMGTRMITCRKDGSVK